MTSPRPWRIKYSFVPKGMALGDLSMAESSESWEIEDASGVNIASFDRQDDAMAAVRAVNSTLTEAK